jgi:hypothetical protein
VIRGENEITKRKILNRKDRSSGGIFQKGSVRFSVCRAR